MKPRHRTLMVLALALAALAPACKPQRDDASAPPPCEESRIRKIYAIPGALLLIDRTSVEVETHAQRVRGEAKIAFTVRTDGESQGQVALSPLEACADDSAACYGVTCVGIGGSEEIDDETGLPTAGVRVGVTVDDDECRDESEIWIQCLQPPDEQTCNTCVERIDIAQAAALGSACLGPLLLNGDAEQLAGGCLGDEACEALWSCEQRSLCHVPDAAACYCGELGDPSGCADPSYQPTGACELEMRDAFEAQLMRAPESNAELLEHMFDMLDAPSGFPSLAVANALTTGCLRPDRYPAPPKTRALLEASGLSREAVQACVDACFR